MRPLYICLATDNNYIPLASVAIESIMENNKECKEIEFFILDVGITENGKNILKTQVEKENRKIFFLDVSKQIEEIEKLGAISQGNYKSYAAYARFFAIDLLPKYIDKILYVDCDTCNCGKLNELFTIDLKENVLGAVIDILPDFHKKSIDFLEDDLYFNSGVLLFNCKEWKENKILEKIKKHLVNVNNKYSFHDQDIINIICKNKILPLSPKYMVFLPEYTWRKKGILKLTNLKENTYYSDTELMEAVKNPIIIHYVDGIFGRPWYKKNKGKYDKYWKKYMKKTPYADNYPYITKERTIKHKLFERCYNILPKNLIIYINKTRKNEILKKRENLL